jgi:hypothetical protein
MRLPSDADNSVIRLVHIGLALFIALESVFILATLVHQSWPLTGGFSRSADPLRLAFAACTVALVTIAYALLRSKLVKSSLAVVTICATANVAFSITFEPLWYAINRSILSACVLYFVIAAALLVRSNRS